MTSFQRVSLVFRGGRQEAEANWQALHVVAPVHLLNQQFGGFPVWQELRVGDAFDRFLDIEVEGEQPTRMNALRSCAWIWAVGAEDSSFKPPVVIQMFEIFTKAITESN